MPPDQALQDLARTRDMTFRSDSNLERLPETAGSAGGAVFANLPDMRKPTLVVALGLVLSACAGSSDDKRQIWNGDSAGIAFELTGPTGQRLCEFSATRQELTDAQLDGLSSLRLHDAEARAGCDIPSYAITIRGGDGSSASYQATHVACSASPILLFEDFDAWAKSTPCSLQP